MGIIRTAIIGVKGKKIQSAIFFIIVLLILLFEITGLLLYSASQIAEEDAYRQIGISIAVTPIYEPQSDNEIIITDDMINNLIIKDHVVGYDSLLESYCTPKNFHNDKTYTGVNPATQNNKADDSLEEIEINKDQIDLIGGLNIEYNERFYKSQNILIKGEYPDQVHNGAIISEQLANANRLEIGDVLSVGYDDTQNTTDINIIGIYRTNLEFKVLETNFAGEGVFRSSPYNIIYTNYDIVNLLKNNICPLINLKVWVDSPEYIKTVMDEISSEEIWEDFEVHNITEIIYNEYAQQLTTTGNTSEYLIIISLLFGGIILIIAMTFFANSYMYETGLYTVLGLKRSRILTIQFLQAFIVVFAALMVSLVLSPLITNILNNVIKVNYISVMNSSTVSCYYTGDMDIQQNFRTSVTPEIIIKIAAVLVIIVIVCVVIPFLATMRVKPREILTENKKG